MAKYVCSVCGYVYDEAKGIPEAGIMEGTWWAALPDDWVCPWCGAPKSEFKKQGEAEEKKPAPVPAAAADEDSRELTAMELSIICSNLARGCEKQYMEKESALFSELAAYFKAAAPAAEAPAMGELLTLVERDLSEGFPAANAAASDPKDRGALRALVWSEKVSRILKSLLSRYEREGEGLIQNTGVYVCTICGFVFVGDQPPKLCPVCKVPDWKFEKVEGRAQ